MCKRNRSRSLLVKTFVITALYFFLCYSSVVGQADIQQLITELGSKDQEQQLEAARKLSTVGSQAVEPLIDALVNNKNRDVRKNAAVVLGMIKDARALDALVKCLKDRDGIVRWSSAWSLGEIGDVGAIDGLVDALKDSYSTTRHRAAEALGKIGSDRAISHLFPLLRDSNKEVRDAAKAAIAKIKG